MDSSFERSSLMHSLFPYQVLAELAYSLKIGMLPLDAKQSACLHENKKILASKPHDAKIIVSTSNAPWLHDSLLGQFLSKLMW